MQNAVEVILVVSHNPFRIDSALPLVSTSRRPILLPHVVYLASKSGRNGQVGR